MDVAICDACHTATLFIADMNSASFVCVNCVAVCVGKSGHPSGCACADHAIRSIDLGSSYATTVAGGVVDGYVDGIGTAARFRRPLSIASRRSSTTAILLFVADQGNRRIRVLSVTDDPTMTIVDTLAGSGVATGVATASDGAALEAMFKLPLAVALSADGKTLYVADLAMVRMVSVVDSAVSPTKVRGGMVTTLAGSDELGFADGTAASARFRAITAIALDVSGTSLYVADNFNNRIRSVNVESGVVSTFAGSGKTGVHDGWRLVDLRSNITSEIASVAPSGLVIVDESQLVFSSQQTNQLGSIDLASGWVQTLVGLSGLRGSKDSIARWAELNAPLGLAVSADGRSVFIADTLNHKVPNTTLNPKP